jgi:hypothetical protein
MTQTDRTVHDSHPGGSQPTRRRSWLLAALAAGLSTAVVITAIVASVDDDAGTPTAGSAADPAEQADPDSEAAGQPGDEAAQPSQMHQATLDPAGTNTTMYYLGPENPNAGNVLLFAEPHTVPEATPVAAVREFLTSYPLDPDYASGWPEGVDVTAVVPADASGMATIELLGEADLAAAGTLDRQAAQTAIQGLIRTAGITDGTVRFTYNEDAVDRLLGVAVPSQGVPAQPEQSEDFSVMTRAAIQVTSPVEGQQLSSPVVVTGNGNVFEGTVNWQLLDGADREIDSGFVTAGFMEWVDFEVDLGNLKPGSYTFRAVEFSAEDGSEVNVDDKSFTVE